MDETKEEKPQEKREMSSEDIAIAKSAGLSKLRKFNAKTFALCAVAELRDDAQLEKLHRLAHTLKAEGFLVRMEEKAKVKALYVF